MRISTIAALWFSAFVTAAWSQPQVKVGSEPSPMEAFAAKSDAHTVWSSQAGRMEHDVTHAVLIALVVEDSAQPVRKVRGVKVELSDGDRHDQVYLDEEAATRTWSALKEITDLVGQRASLIRNGCVGAREFTSKYDWRWNKYHELNIDFCGQSKDTALVLHGRGKDVSFRFPGENPSHLAEILAAATDQLKQH